VVVAVWAVLVALLKLLSVFAERFFAFLAGEGLGRLLERVVGGGVIGG